MSDLPDWQTQVQEVSAVYIRADGTVDFTADESMGGNKLTHLGAPSDDADADTKGARNTALASYLPLSGGTMSGAIAMGTHKITGLDAPAADADAARKIDVDTVNSRLDDISTAQPSRNLTSIYQNTSGKILFVQVVFKVAAQGEDDDIELKIGSASPPTTIRDHDYVVYAYHPYGSVCGFVPPGYYYRAVSVGAGDATLYKWTEDTFF